MVNCTWTFEIVLNRALTEEEIDAFSNADEFADGAVGLTISETGPATLPCDVEAPTLLEAIGYVARDIATIGDLYPVRVLHDDIVTLGEAAQRCRGKRTRQSLVQLAKGQRGPGGFPAPVETTGGTAFYSWAEVAAYLRQLGDDIDPVPRDLVIADHLVRTAAELRGTPVPRDVLQALGLANAA
ncbi:MAG: hypothetical protein JO362_22635 [Streptomycetaceae bacterium]|nr:hypothetical protein [Streptomycetaceae bacterium]